MACQESCALLMGRGRWRVCHPWPDFRGAGPLVFIHPFGPAGLTSVAAQGPSSEPWPLLLAHPLSCRQSPLPAGGIAAAGPAGLSGKMDACRRKALTLLSSVFAVCGLGLLGVAVSTDHWLYLEEGVVLPQNQSTETKMSLHSGLWRVCFLAGKGAQGRGQPCPQRGAAATSHPPGKQCPCWKEAGHRGRHSRALGPLPPVARTHSRLKA